MKITTPAIIMSAVMVVLYIYVDKEIKLDRENIPFFRLGPLSIDFTKTKK